MHLSFILELEPELSHLGYWDAISRWPHRFGSWDPFFLVVVACSNSLWVVVMDVDILGLIYFDVGARTFKPGVSGCDILLATLIQRT